MDDLRTEVRKRRLSDDAIAQIVGAMPDDAVHLMLEESADEEPLPLGPAEQAELLDPKFVVRPHLRYLSERITDALRDVESGKNRRLLVSMPPRVGKSTLCTLYTPVWNMRQHPDWDHVLVSHEATLAVSWSRAIRRLVEKNGATLGFSVADDAGAVSEWETTKEGRVLARTWHGSLIGRGARVMLIDDPIKDFAEAHSDLTRQALWEWWLTTAQSRLEPPTLVIVVMTRWHEDDFAGRLMSNEYEGDPADWEVIRFPAIAEDADVLGRDPGEPLLSPLLDETTEEALARWNQVKSDVGSYAFSAMYQQDPSPAKGNIFDPGWWRYWTVDPNKATEDGSVVLLDPATDLIGKAGARWLDSWDCAFKGTTSSDYVVGQRWCRKGANRYLIAQSRARRSFTETLREMKFWCGDPPDDDEPVEEREPIIGTGATHERLVEDKANGTAVIDVLKKKVSGLIPINPTDSKEARARSVTPEVESGHVYLPHPTDPGNEWVLDFLDEARNFPRGLHDDQIDACTQALRRMRDTAAGKIGNPARAQGLTGRSIGRTALTQQRRYGSPDRRRAR